MSEVAFDLENLGHRDGSEVIGQGLNPNDIIAGRRAVVVGLGKSGIAAAHFLASRGVQVTVSESRPLSSLNDDVIKDFESTGIKVEAGGNREALFENADFIVLSPGVPLDIHCIEVAKKNGVPVIGEFGLAAMFLKTPCIAITGTNGKSTVTALIGEMFKAARKKVFVGGNIGTPLSEYVLGEQNTDVVVLEVSSFQLDTAGPFKPNVAILLNISPDHLDRYASYQDYVSSKWSIFQNQDASNIAILNMDDPEISRNIVSTYWDHAAHCYSFSNTKGDLPGVYWNGRQVVLFGLDEARDEMYDLAGTELIEEPNRQNAMAAILAARLADCSPSGVQEGMRKFNSLPHRLALVDEIDGVRYFDDSKATNVGAVVKALDSMNDHVVLIAGGKGKLGGYELLAKVAKDKVKACVLIGESKQEMADALKKATSVFQVENLTKAVFLAAELARQGEVVLLSPACASFDMFDGYGNRGDVFRQAVNKLKNCSEAGGKKNRNNE